MAGRLLLPDAGNLARALPLSPVGETPSFKRTLPVPQKYHKLVCTTRGVKLDRRHRAQATHNVDGVAIICCVFDRHQ